MWFYCWSVANNNFDQYILYNSPYLLRWLADLRYTFYLYKNDQNLDRLVYSWQPNVASSLAQKYNLNRNVRSEKYH
ncbi:hypothetical protein D3C80_948470 [compost metagenome]